MNEHEKPEQPQEMNTAVTPPPFRPGDDQQDVQQEASASPTLADRIAAMGLDELATSRLQELTTGIDTEALSEALLATLAQGLTHDEDVQNADAAGYLRGRNEKIEAVLHRQPQDEEKPQATPVFPRYCRRSIWD